MKKLPLILGILILLDIAVLAILNQGQSLNIVYFPEKSPYTMSLTAYTIALAVYAGVGTFLICYYQIKNLTERLKKQTRNIEKAYIETQDSSDKVKSLQAKIDTL